MTTHERPVLRLRPKTSAQRFRFGAPWVFADETVLDRRTRALKPGTIVALQDNDRRPFGVGAINPNSKIIARILDLDPEANIDAPWLEARISRALAMRAHLYPAPFYRLIHAEADGFPGLIVDRFGDVLVMQPNAAWADARVAEISAALAAVTGVKTIFVNASGRARGLEGLDDQSRFVLGAIDGPIPVPMNGVTYLADITGGQKTGLFFDQRDNHAFAARLAHGGTVLDVFSHVGGFALAALAGGATHATAVDASDPALKLAADGASQGGFADRFTTITGDAVATMRELAETGKVFDTVICDPPAFAPNKQALEAGLRGYEKVALNAAKLVAPGGYLVLCSCSHAADLTRFRDVSLRGIGRGGRRAQLLKTGFAGADHPVHAALAESAYLKALFFRLN